MASSGLVNLVQCSSPEHVRGSSCVFLRPVTVTQQLSGLSSRVTLLTPHMGTFTRYSSDSCNMSVCFQVSADEQSAAAGPGSTAGLSAKLSAVPGSGPSPGADGVGGPRRGVLQVRLPAEGATVKH